MPSARRHFVAVLACLAAALAGCTPRPAAPNSACAILGIDVSRHQGLIDWPQVAASGVRFAWIKATEGGDYRDPLFRRNWLLAQAAGVRRGAYHFLYWCRPAPAQAAWLAANVPDDPDALTPVLDVEWTPGSRSCPDKVARQVGEREVATLLAAMRRTYRRAPILYAPADIYREILAGGVAETAPLWARSLRGPPEELYGPRPWVVRQYSETGRVAGIAVDVDLDCASAEQAVRLGLVTPRRTVPPAGPAPPDAP